MTKCRKITATLVNDYERMNFMPTHFGNLFLHVEYAIFDKLSEMSKDYNGGYWNMYRLSNGGIYLAPNIINLKLRLSVATNGYSGEVSADAAGLITCMFVFNALCWQFPERQDFNDLYYALRDFAFDHEEACEIIQAVD